MVLKKGVLRDWALKIIPLVIVLFLVFGSLSSLSSMVAQANPVVGWIQDGQAYYNQPYSINFSSDVSCDWIYDCPDWLAPTSPLNDTASVTFGGFAADIGNYSINISAMNHGDHSRTTLIDVPVDVIETDMWGYLETFDGVATGAHGNSTLDEVILKQAVNTESVVLDGFIWIMSRGTSIDAENIIYDSPLPSNHKGWNLSYETYAPKENSAFPKGTLSGNYGLRSYLLDENEERITGVEMSFGTSNESISILNTTYGNWTRVSNDILPAVVMKSDSEGLRPDRYVVSYEYSMGDECRILIWHSKSGKIFDYNVSVNATSLFSPDLAFHSDVNNTYGITGAWIVDNIAFRSLDARYPIAQPDYEYIYEDKPTWVEVVSQNGEEMSDAKVTIDGLFASFDSSSQRYEVQLSELPDWSKRIDYTVTVDGIEISDSMEVTFMNSEPSPARVETWWNGWEWATVFGLDDAPSCSAAVNSFDRYSHPTTAYLIGVGGVNSDILASQSELAMHTPHEYSFLPIMFWKEAVDNAETGHSLLESQLNYASRWDDPSYVGKGDMYISMANPGNSASYEAIFALYARGTRIDGVSSNPVPGSLSAGNASLIGSWWIPQEGGWSTPGSQSWQPMTKIDLMDADRAIRTEGTTDAQWDLIFYAAERHGLLRIYTHQKDISSSNAPVFLEWIDNNKTNYSLENWKTTDGEAASYVYGKWSTDINYDSASSDTDKTVFKVSRKDPIEAGYWRVPITVSIDLGGKQDRLKDVIIGEGARTLKSSDGTLKNLNGARIMDLGYDIRGGRLYISYFWNESSTLELSFDPTTVAASALHGPNGEGALIDRCLTYPDSADAISISGGAGILHSTEEIARPTERMIEGFLAPA
jgi:hypothetical protein